MANLRDLEKWLLLPAETESIEFKQARSHFDVQEVLRYCVALSNERGGHLILGVTDVVPRRVVGSRAFETLPDLNALTLRIYEKLQIRVEAFEISHAQGRVLVLKVPSRPAGHPIAIDGAFLMRSGSSLVPMSTDRIKDILDEVKPGWLGLDAVEAVTAEDVVELLDTQVFFELLREPYPTSRKGVLEKLVSAKLIRSEEEGYFISNLAAISLAKKLSAFSPELARKGFRVVIYDGVDKLQTRDDKVGSRGYAAGFQAVIDFVHSSAPQNRFVEEAIRKEVKMFPKQALRELIANAVVHQDFGVSGASVMIELYADRVEISNPGVPPISVTRFIDEYQSRNERLADLMRRFGICEEKGSGIDKVVAAAEAYQLPAPDFRVGELRTTSVLFAHQDFSVMSRADRIRACYQHCCLLHVSNRKMSNESLRERFSLPASKTALVSQVIGATRDEGLIRLDDSESTSTRYARYLPFWA